MNAAIKKRIADLEASVGKERLVFWVGIESLEDCAWTDGTRSWHRLPGETDEQLKARIMAESDSACFYVNNPNLQENFNV